MVGLEWTVGAGKRKRAIWVPGRAIGFLGHSSLSSMIIVCRSKAGANTR